jgi:hypothetical protein
LDRIVRESSGRKTLADLKAATPSSYHGPHNSYLTKSLRLKEAGFVDVDCFWKLGTTVVYGGFKS